MVEAVELLACHVFNMADREDRSVSMEMMRTQLDRLRQHPASCCQLCAEAAMVWRVPTSTASPRRGSGRPPPPGCVRCADSCARSSAPRCDRVGRPCHHTGAVPFVRLRRAQLARLGARSANLGQTADYSQAIAQFVDRRSRPLLCAKADPARVLGNKSGAAGLLRQQSQRQRI